jgi:hypothetical protein
MCQARETMYRSITPGMAQSPWEIIVACHQATLHLMYFLGLCQAYGLPKSHDFHQDSSPIQVAQYSQPLSDEAARVINILIELFRLDLLSRLPPLLLTAVFSAGLTRLTNRT